MAQAELTDNVGWIGELPHGSRVVIFDAFLEKTDPETEAKASIKEKGLAAKNKKASFSSTLTFLHKYEIGH